MKTKDPKVLPALAATCQDDADEHIIFENEFTYLALTCPVSAKVNKRGKISFDANVSGTEGKHAGGLGGNREKPGKGTTGVALPYHK